MNQRPLVLYDPAATPGTQMTDGDGRTIQYVAPDAYFKAMLGTVMNATVVFLKTVAPGAVAEGMLHSVDDAIAQEYWDTYDGCLMPTALLALLSRSAIGPTGEILLEGVESARQEMFAAGDLTEAEEIHASFRVQFLLQGAERFLTDAQVAVGEFLTDYIFLQRCVAEDVRQAESRRAPGEPRAVVLERMDSRAELAFEKGLAKVLRPKRALELIPAHKMPDIEDFVRRRRPLAKTGLLEGDEAGA